MTYWSDISSYQPVVDNGYPWSVLAIRSNDGDYRDPHFSANYAWGLRALESGRLKVLIVYFVWRPNVVTTVDTHLAMLGATHPGVVSMIDVESWGGQISGDQSAGINQAHSMLAAHWGDPRRVLGYGNRGDLNALWPHRPNGLRLVVASYGPPIAYPGLIAQQVTDGVNGPVTSVAPFGRADVNRSDLSPDQLAAVLGVEPARSKVETVIQQFPVSGNGVLELGAIVGSASALYSTAWVSVRCNAPDGACDLWWGLSGGGGRGERHWGPPGRPAPGAADGTLGVNQRQGAQLKTTDGVDQVTVHHFFGSGSGVITLELAPR
jgi:hypothetical protein